VIDANVHVVLPGEKALLPYLGPHWREYQQRSNFRAGDSLGYPKTLPDASRDEPKPENGPRGSSLEITRATVLERWGVEMAVLTPTYGLSAYQSGDLAAAFASALNDWQAEEWLAREPRFRGSIVVSPQDPDYALAELERCAARGGFVQVLLPVRSDAPYGKRRWHRFFAAAAAADLPVALMLGGLPGVPSTSSGWPSFFAEEHVAVAQTAQGQLMSLVAEGVLPNNPRLRIVLVECGFAWLPSMAWRLDKNWKGLRQEVPWVQRPPSEYVREQVRLTTHPLETCDPHDLAETIRMIGPETLLWGSGYPRYDAEPDQAYPAGLDGAVVESIRSANARSVYRLESPAPAR
jgi:predicted TIM-barrel fold metal-dependent hydrolase